MTRRAAFSLALLLLATTSASLARAQSEAAATGSDATESMADATASEDEMADERARNHFRVGRSLYDAGRFAEAAVEFQAAYDLSQRADLLYNVYLAHRDAQNEAAALTALRDYLRLVPDAPERAHLTARADALAATVAAAEAEAAERERERLEAERQRIEAERTIAEERARADANAARSRPLWPWALVGAGVAFIGAGVPLGVVAANDANAARRACDQLNGTTVCDPTVEIAERRSSILPMAAAGDALWASGAVLAAAGLVLFFVLPDDTGSPASPAPTATASCGPTGCVAQMEVSF
jgi:tetratricopeptide (TPR) repeat protein